MLSPQSLKISREFILKKIKHHPQIGIILGSGLESVAGLAKNPITIDYSAIPYFVSSTVSGHRCKLIVGEIENKKVLFLQGRVHYYEGYSLEQITYPVRLLAALGVKIFLNTGAAGAIARYLKPGDLVAIKDHLNFLGENPLRGSGIWGGNIFLDLSQMYSHRLRNLMLSTAKKLGMIMKQGVYAAVSGPTYETPTELAALRKLGADVVAMSVVPENIVAYQEGMGVASLVYIANKPGKDGHRISHREVLEAGEMVSERFKKILGEFVTAY